MTLGPPARRLLRTMTGEIPPDAAGQEPPDLSRVGAEELGTLLVAAWQVSPEAPPPPVTAAAAAVRLAAQERSPVFTPAACAELFVTAAERGFSPALAVAAALRCAGPLPPELAAPAAVLAPGARHHAGLALAALAGPAIDAAVGAGIRAELAGEPLAAAEIDAVMGLDAAGRAVATEADRYAGRGGMAPLPGLVERLAGYDGYAAFARAALETADARVADIHSGRIGYAADKAFTAAEADVLWRACQVALLRDEPWLGELLRRLLPGVVVAPTAARTAPSQSAGNALAQAVAAWPTPEAVAALGAARTAVRHAGLAKKLDRSVPVAEENLARRPAIALRLPAGATPTRAQLTTMVRALEGGYLRDLTFLWRQWHAEIPADLAARLIWDVETAPGRWETTLGAPPRGERVRLWHPATATAAQRAAWRDTVVRQRLTQPVRQAFREHYAAGGGEGAGTGMFAGTAVAIRPLLRAAANDGWRGLHGLGLLRRDLGRWRVSFAVDGPLYGDATGTGDTGAVHLEALDAGQWRPARLADAPPVLVSEVLRSVDRLVRAAAFDVPQQPDAPQPSQADRMRRAALRRIFAGVAGVSFGERHAHAGRYAVELSTAHVTRDGAPVSPGVIRAAAPPWLPFEDHLCERVARILAALADAGKIL
jgi:hypothetical protein